jgi:hypothetical protein
MRGPNRMVPLALLALIAVAGCSIQQQVTPVAASVRPGGEICVVEDKSVREGFLPAYTRALQAKGFVVKVVASNAEAQSCALSSTYMANWRWDLALYLAYVKITVLRDGQQVGVATYDSLLGGGRLDKFIDADTKINELVGQLFPG